MNYPFYMPQQQTIPQYPAQRQEIVRVNGRGGAEAYQLAPNSSALLLDTTAPVVWLKTTDGAGYPTVAAYDIAPAQTQEQKDASRFSALEKRISDLEVLIHAQSDPRSAGTE